MTELNRKAAEAMLEVGANACTDVTGFGLLGHLCEMVEGSGVGVRLDVVSVPLIPGTRKLADIGLVPAGAYRNRKFREHLIETEREIKASMLDILFDPQTSGGLLISLPEDKVPALLQEFRKKNVHDIAIIAEVMIEPKHKILLT
jgi:selenide,water dikinase